jgi:UDP-N-acetylmuramyl pentapeptide synthase
MKKLLALILKKQALLAIARSKPLIIAITGSYGKTSAKDALTLAAMELFPEGSVRSAKKSFNNELGIPLTILGYDAPGKSIFAWVKLLVGGWFSQVPPLLILEVGADHKGEIEMWASLIKPDISVITGVSPVHVANYASYEELQKEKSYLGVYATQAVILNGDDDAVLAMRPFKAPTIAFGVRSENDCVLEVGELMLRSDYAYEPGELMTQFSGHFIGKDFNEAITLKNATGKGALIATLIAFTAIRALVKLPRFSFAHPGNLDIVKAIEKTWKPTVGRMNPIPGIKNTLILDDSYNAAPTAVEHGLYVLSVFPNQGRKIAALGRMAELGKMSDDMHAQMGEWVAKSADYFVAVGEEALLAIESAKKAGMRVDQISWFKDSKLAGRFLDGFVESGDVIYVKGSQSARMEFVVKDLFVDPARAGEFLVRQESQWLK